MRSATQYTHPIIDPGQCDRVPRSDKLLSLRSA
jgi:hypothetical protein